MKHLFAVLTAFAILGFAVPAFACDKHGAKAEASETMTSGEEQAEDHACTADCSHEDKAKKVKKETKSEDGEV